MSTGYNNVQKSWMAFIMLPQTVFVLLILIRGIITGDFITVGVCSAVILVFIMVGFALAHIKVYDEDGHHLVAETGPFKLCLCLQISHKAVSSP